MKLRINPVYKKELKISVRSAKLSWVIFVFNSLLAMIGVLAFYFNFDVNGVRNISYSSVLVVYTLIAMLEFGLILFVVPAFTANAIAGERERQTLEILLTTTLRPGQIILGKLMSSISTMILLVFSSFPVMAIVFAVGGIRFLDLLQFMAFACVTAIFIGSIGILFSTFFKKTIPATVFTYGSVMVLIAGTLAILGVICLLMRQQYDNAFYGSGQTGVYDPPDVGGLVLLLLVNPAVSMFSLLTNQYGSQEEFREFLEVFGGVSQNIINSWYYLSVGVQLVLSGVFLKLAAWRLRAK